MDELDPLAEMETYCRAFGAALLPTFQAIGQAIEGFGATTRAVYTTHGSPYGPTDADMWRWVRDQPALPRMPAPPAGAP